MDHIPHLWFSIKIHMGFSVRIQSHLLPKDVPLSRPAKYYTRSPQTLTNGSLVDAKPYSSLAVVNTPPNKLPSMPYRTFQDLPKPSRTFQDPTAINREKRDEMEICWMFQQVRSGKTDVCWVRLIERGYYFCI